MLFKPYPEVGRTGAPIFSERQFEIGERVFALINDFLSNYFPLPFLEVFHQSMPVGIFCDPGLG
jgi:hypothetical protein